jgi:type IV pilus assembly protein PilO
MSKMTNVLILAVAAVIAVVAIGYYFVLSPQKANAAKVHKNVATEQAANDALRLQLARLTKEEAAVPIQQARIAAIDREIPVTTGLPSYVRFLTSAAAKSHLELVSIAPASPAAVTALAPVVTAAPAAASGAKGTAASAAPVAPAASAPPALSSMMVTMNIVGSYFAVQDFVRRLEAGSGPDGSGRATVVSSVTMLPGILPVASGAGSSANSAASYKTLQTQISATIFMSNVPAVTAGSGPGTTSPVGGAATAAPAAPSTTTSS